MPNLSLRIALGLLIGVLLLVVVTVGPSMCSRMLSAEKQAKLNKAQGDAAIGAGSEAMNTAGVVGSNAASTDEKVRQGHDEIDKAPAGDSNDAALRAACRMNSYRDTTACKQWLKDHGDGNMEAH